MANIIQASVRLAAEKAEHSEHSEGSPSKQNKDSSKTSPVKTVLGAFARRGPETKIVPKNEPKKDKLRPLPPESIEDVPFRRQDRRILNARKKRVADRKLIRCLLITALLLVVIGGACLAAWWQLEDEEPLLGPLIIIGAVLLVSGLMFLLFFGEALSRLRKNQARVQDPEIDRMRNLHHIKHWVDPELIPYGWGQDGDESAPMTPEQHKKRAAFAADEAELASSRGGAGVVPNSNDLDGGASIDVDNPHQSMAIEMSSSAGAPQAAHDDDADIGSDIFDESQRYDDVDRPRLTIDHSSPTRAEQRRGSFVADEDRIANLFSPKKKSRP